MSRAARTALATAVFALFAATAFADADLEIQKTAPVAVPPNVTFPFSITVTNHGPDPALNVAVTDNLPAGVVLESVNTTQGSCAGDPNVVCNLGSILNGSAATITMQVHTTSNSGHVMNTASVESTIADPNLGNNSDTADAVVLGDVDLSIVKTAPAGVIPNAPFPYTITVTNQGPAIATFVTVNDLLPDSVDLLSANSSQGSCAGDPNVICNLGSIDPGEDATITLSVQTALTSGTIENTATVSGNLDQLDTNQTNNSDSASTLVQSAAVIPTLNEWMLIALASILAIVAIMRVE